MSSSDGECLHRRFEQQAAAAPDAPAVTFSGATLSYDTLNQRSNRLAHHLQAQGVGHETRVGLCLDRSIDTVVAILAVLKAGGAYVPMDPIYPAERVRMIVDDAECPVLLLHRAQQERFVEDGTATLIVMDDDERPWESCSSDNPDNEVTGESLAYVIYTSGSTGKPKGALIVHRNVYRLFEEMQPDFGFNSDDVWTMFHSYAFDFSVWELWGAFFFGGRLVVVPQLISRTPETFHQLLLDEKVTVLSQTPSAFKQLQLFDETLPLEVSRRLALRYVLIGGEFMALPELAPWYERHGDETPRLIHVYGITETTVFVTYRPLSRADTVPGTPSLIGKAISDLTVYVLDESGEQVAVGEIGELFVGGPGVCRGYLNRPELTAERFLPNPFSETDVAPVLYKTGDLVRLLDGDLEFIGRNDMQVQLRGFRVELGEIASELNLHESVRGAVVSLREDVPGGDPSLVGYYLARMPLEVAELRTHLLKALPPYMVPSWFVHMEAMPLNNNGKIDMAALPTPEFDHVSGDYVAPRTDREKALVAIWEEVMGVPKVGVEDSFFEMGGHSLLATQLIVRIEKQFSVKLPLRVFLENPTIAAHAQAIAAVEFEGAIIEAQAPLPKADRSQPLPLSFSQEQLWVLSKLEEELTTYNVSLLFSLRGPVDSTALKAAINHVIARHEVLRTVFVEENGVPAQRVLDSLDVPLTTISLLDTPAERQQESLYSSARTLAGKPMHLGKGPLIEAQLFQLGAHSFQLFLVIHHIVFDGWSISVLLDDLADAYQHTVAGTSLSREPLSHQFADYALWQRQMIESPELKQQRSYWQRQLATPLPVLEVPLDFPRPPRQTFVGEVLQRSFSPALRSALEVFARKHRVTPFVTLLAGWKALLYRYTGQEDCIVGTALAGRSRVELESLIGFFINTVAVRTQVARDLPFEKLLARVDRSTREAQENQDIPFEQVVAECQAGRDPSRSPIFQVMFVFHNTPDYSVEFSGITMRGEEISNGGSKFDLTMSVQPSEDGYLLNLEYNTALYKAATMETLLSRYESLLSDVLRAPERPVGQLALTEAVFSESPLESDVSQRQAAPVSYDDAPECLHTLFEEQARNTPDAPAVTCEGFTLSYKELNVRANQVANYLADHGVGPDTLVGLCLDRSIDTVLAILGVLKSGAAYVPMDPVYPPERMRLIIEDAQCSVVITHVAQRKRFEEDGDTTILVLDNIETDLSRYSSENRRCDIGEDDLAYVIYTSGSTGKPKGALISHRNVTRLFSSMEPWFSFSEKDSWTLFHSYAFDFSIWEIWGAFLYGGRVVVVPYVVSRSPEYFYQLLVDEQITVLSQTPSAFKQLQHHEELQPLSAVQDLALRYVVFGGEVLDLPSLLPWFDRHGEDTPQMINMYGITETTVFITYRPVKREDTKPGTPNYIGIPIPDLTLHVLDEAMKEVALGEVGELYVGGAGVGGGYLRRPKLNKERFIPDPFTQEAGAILYKTGDLVRLLDADLEFIGRNDQQVQLRGFRVELGEIEAVLNSHAELRGTIVRAREDIPGDMRLVAYYLAKEEVPLASLRSCVAEKLPGYMIPSRFIWLASFPLTNNGKVDVDALPAPVVESASEEDCEGPQNEVERVLADIWRSLLRLERVDVRDNFFELGGHSLLAIQVLTQVNEKLGTQLGLRDFFDSPTIKSLAALTARGNDAQVENGMGSKWLLQLKEGSGIPFFCVKGAGDVGGSYDTFANAMGDFQPFYGFPDLDFDDLEGSGEPFTIEKLAHRCIKEIVKIQPSGPYYVGGYSFGGVVAYEIARQLLEAGEEVPLIAMLDSAIPEHHEVSRGLSVKYGLHLLNRIRVRLMMLGYTWKMVVGYGRDAVRVLVRRILRPGSVSPTAPGWRDYLRWIQLDTSVQYFLVQAGLVEPTIGERRLEMVEEQLVRHSTRSMVASKEAMAKYALKPISARITLFRAEHNPWKTERHDPTFGWDQYAERGVDVVVVPGNHMVIIRWPYASDLGKALQKVIDDLQRGA